MKVVLAILIVALAYVNAKPALTSEQRDKFKETVKDCKAKHEITDEEIHSLWQHKIPETEAGKCFAGCINKGLGVLDADNKVDLKHVTKFWTGMKDKLGDDFEPMMKVYETCAAEATGDNECEVSTKLMECKNREFEAAGIKLDYKKIFSH